MCLIHRIKSCWRRKCENSRVILFVCYLLTIWKQGITGNERLSEIGGMNWMRRQGSDQLDRLDHIPGIFLPAKKADISFLIDP